MYKRIGILDETPLANQPNPKSGRDYRAEYRHTPLWVRKADLVLQLHAFNGQEQDTVILKVIKDRYATDKTSYICVGIDEYAKLLLMNVAPFPESV